MMDGQTGHVSSKEWNKGLIMDGQTGHVSSKEWNITNQYLLVYLYFWLKVAQTQ
jgi:hypothetical protein